MIEWAQKFGFGQQTGIELSDEEAHGLVPNATWKQEVLNEDWYPGDTVNFSVGQGVIQATPLQVAVMFAALVTVGDQITPQLQKGSDALTRRQPINLSPTTLEELQQGLRAVVTRGTGKAIKHFFTPTCGRQKRHC